MSTTELTKETFDDIVEQGIVFVDFWAAWCGPCRAFAPIYERAAAKHPDIVWGKVDTEAQPELAGMFQVRAIPTLMAFRDGILLFEQPGVVPALTLEKLVQQIRDLDMSEVKKKVAEQQRQHAAPASP